MFVLFIQSECRKGNSLSRREESWNKKLSDCLSEKGQKNILLLMFSRKLDQRVFEGGPG